MLEFGVNEVNAERGLVPFVHTEVSFLKQNLLSRRGTRKQEKVSLSNGASAAGGATNLKLHFELAFAPALTSSFASIKALDQSG